MLKAVGTIVAVAVLAPLAFAGGSRKIESKPFTAPATALASKTVKCGSGSQVSGGGSSYTPLTINDNSWRDNSLFPSGSRAWDVQVDNLSGIEHQGEAIAVCLKGDDLTRESQSEAVDGDMNQSTTTSVECPKGSSATGGGGDESGQHNDMHILATRPSGNRAWSIDTFTSISYAGSQEAYVICDPKNSHDYTTVHGNAAPVRATSRRGTVVETKAKAKCPKGSVVTGGGYSYAGDPNVSIVNNRPKGERTWLLTVRTFSPGQGFTAYARCLKG